MTKYTNIQDYSPHSNKKVRKGNELQLSAILKAYAQIKAKINAVTNFRYFLGISAIASGIIKQETTIKYIATL